MKTTIKSGHVKITSNHITPSGTILVNMEHNVKKTLQAITTVKTRRYSRQSVQEKERNGQQKPSSGNISQSEAVLLGNLKHLIMLAGVFGDFDADLGALLGGLDLLVLDLD